MSLGVGGTSSFLHQIPKGQDLLNVSYSPRV